MHNKKIFDDVYQRIIDTISSQFDEYEPPRKIAASFHLSLSFVYDILNHENIDMKKDGNIKKYNMKQFIKLFNFNKNFKIYDDGSNVNNYLNNAINFEAKNPIESFYMNYLVDTYGEFATAKEIASELKISDKFVYEEILAGNIQALALGTRRIIITRSLIYYFREMIYAS